MFASRNVNAFLPSSFRHSNHHLDVQHICFWLCLTKRYAAFLSLYLELMSHQNWLRSLPFTLFKCIRELYERRLRFDFFIWHFNWRTGKHWNSYHSFKHSALIISLLSGNWQKNRNLDCSQFNQHIPQRKTCSFYPIRLQEKEEK